MYRSSPPAATARKSRKLDIKPSTFRVPFARPTGTDARLCRCVYMHDFTCRGSTCPCRAERVDWLSSRSIAPPRLRPRVNACDRHPIAMPPRKPLYILVGMFYNPWKDTLEPVRTAETDAMCEFDSSRPPLFRPCFRMNMTRRSLF